LIVPSDAVQPRVTPSFHITFVSHSDSYDKSKAQIDRFRRSAPAPQNCH
jgi:hypothetical protein